MSKDNMTYEELVEAMRSLGLGQGPRVVKPKRNMKATEIPSIRKQMELVVELEKLMQAQIEKDTETLETLREKVNRLKHGGGA
jgi:hypothetical protein